jgi:outer membrane protein insertion porin family
VIGSATARGAILAGLVALACLSAHPARAASSEIPNIELDQVEIEGVTAVDSSAIESALEVSPGDRLERRRVIRSAQNIQALYVSHGYEQASVKSELGRERGDDGKPENVLRFLVTEGLPTRISKITVTAGPDHEARVLEDLQDVVGLEPGDILDQEKLSSGKRAIQEALASDEYIGASMNVIQKEEGVAPKLLDPQSDEPLKAARWVTLELHIDLGDRVTFGFRGNSALSRSRLRSLIDEQRLVGFTQDYIGTIRNRILDEYRGEGFAQVQVEAITLERPRHSERHVTYLIHEGPRVRIEDVQFEGVVVFSAARLEKEFWSRSAPVVQRKIYVDKEVEKGAELVVEWMKSQGYLSSKLVTINRIYDARRQSYRLVVYVYEGDQTLVESVSFEGFSLVSERKVREMLGVKEGAPLNLYAFSEGLEALKALYRTKGYLEARIENEESGEVVRYVQENRYADISLKMAEGPQFRLSRVSFEGLSKTRPVVVSRELRLKPGDVIEESKLNETEAAIRKLGIFSNVSLQLEDDPTVANAKELRITVEEGSPGLVAGGVGYRNDLGVRAFGQVGYGNVLGRNHTLSLSLNGNRRFDEFFCDSTRSAEEKRASPKLGTGDCFLEYQAQLGYVWPWFALGDTTFRPRVTLEKTQFFTFDAFSLTAEAGWERRLLTSVNLMGSFTYGVERVRQFNAPPGSPDNGDYSIGSVTPSLTLDLRDNSLAPTSGFFASASFEYADPTFLFQSRHMDIGDLPKVGYTRTQFRADYFIPVMSGVTWYLSFRTGFERNLEPPPEGTPESQRAKYQIPVIKQFTLGGAGSLRGFNEQEINIQNISLLGTLAYVNYRTQLDLPFSGPLRFGPFLDAGNLYVDSYSLGNLRYGTGFGFHYLSPVGPVNFDLGLKLAPRPDEDKYKFYFSIGVI